MQTVKHPRSHIQETGNNEELEKFNLDSYLPARQSPKVDQVATVSRMSIEPDKKARNLVGRTSSTR